MILNFYLNNEILNLTMINVGIDFRTITGSNQPHH